MTRRLMLALAGVVAMTLTQPAVAASRIYRTDNTWYTVADGRIAFSQFIADGPDGARSFGADPDAEAVYVRLKSTVPASFKRLGVTLSEPAGCAEAPDKNGRGVSGWVFTCVFPLGAPAANAPTPPGSPAPATPPPAPQVVASAPARPAPVKTTVPAAPAAPKPAVQPKVEPAAPNAVLASATPTSAPRPAQTEFVALPSGGGDADLNARVKAGLEQIDARNAARTAEFEAAKKATADAYAAQIAAYQAQVQETERKRQADLEAWKARVAACKAGDTSQCGQ